MTLPSISYPLFERVFREMRQNGTLPVRACRLEGVDFAALRRAMADDPALKALYDEALELAIDAMAEKLLTLNEDYTDPAQARIQQKSYMWLSEKLNAARYGQRVVVEDNRRADAVIMGVLTEAIARIPKPVEPAFPRGADGMIDVTPAAADPEAELRRMGLI